MTGPDKLANFSLSARSGSQGIWFHDKTMLSDAHDMWLQWPPSLLDHLPSSAISWTWFTRKHRSCNEQPLKISQNKISNIIHIKMLHNSRLKKRSHVLAFQCNLGKSLTQTKPPGLARPSNWLKVRDPTFVPSPSPLSPAFRCAFYLFRSWDLLSLSWKLVK